MRRSRWGVLSLSLLALLLLGSPVLGKTDEPFYLLAALPTLPPGMTRLSLAQGGAVWVIAVEQATGPSVLVRGAATTGGAVNLLLRWHLPLDLAPVFLAVEFDGRRLTGLMTLFLGPLGVDLGRSWGTETRWALLHLAVDPHLTWMLEWCQRGKVSAPRIGWRLFPAASARWEMGLMVGRRVSAWSSVLF
jgi:hypothetical protein